jgi:sulfonate dioxygenase
LLTLVQPSFPDVSWDPLKEVKVVDRGSGADPDKKPLLSATSKVITLILIIGTELHGINLRQLSDAQKDEL